MPTPPNARALPAPLGLALALLACGGSGNHEPVGLERPNGLAAHEELAPIVIVEPDEPATEPLELPELAARIELLDSHFDEYNAWSLVAALDPYFRVRGNEGYQRSLDATEAHLAACGFETAALRRLELGPVEPTWTPRSARLELVQSDATTELLHGFENEAERDRATLLIGSDATPTSDFELVDAAAIGPGEDVAGRVVLGQGSSRSLAARWILGAGAAGVLVMDLEPYHDRLGDPTVAQFGYLPQHAGRSAFGFSLSRAAYGRLIDALGSGSTSVRVTIDVDAGTSAATALEARLPGSRPERGAVVLVAHVDEPGANDNASGVAGLAELGCAWHEALANEEIPVPLRPVVFLFGQEHEVSREWLALGEPVAAGFALDMIGEDPSVVGAPFLIERMPDPGAVWVRPPDEHTEWGAGPVSADALQGHYLNDWARAAMRLTASVENGWEARTHPFEGGSDHDSFLARGIPALLGWHFTDEAYHTTADRLDRVSAAEMRRAAIVLGAAALGLANGGEATAQELLDAVVAAAWERAEQLLVNGTAELAICGLLATELSVVAAWERWYDEALASVLTAPQAPSAALSERVDEAKAAWRRRIGEVGGELEREASAERPQCDAKR